MVDNVGRIKEREVNESGENVRQVLVIEREAGESGEGG
jgi:hypothetical protein